MPKKGGATRVMRQTRTSALAIEVDSEKAELGCPAVEEGGNSSFARDIQGLQLKVAKDTHPDGR
jgi:hypothetical protein